MYIYIYTHTCLYIHRGEKATDFWTAPWAFQEAPDFTIPQTVEGRIGAYHVIDKLHFYTNPIHYYCNEL